MENLKEQKVGILVAENYKYADIFKKHHIDFCCGGGVSVSEACRKKDVDEKALLQELESIGKEKPVDYDYKNWELDKLTEHIKRVHHHYVRENLPVLIAYATKVAKVHGDEHPETKEVKQQIDALEEELIPHLNKEEIVLFPYINNLALTSRQGGQPNQAPFGTVKYPVKAMMIEHDNAGDILKHLASLTNDFTPPEDACNTYRVLYHKLEEFQNDLFLHIHLENNILFPKSKKLEVQVTDNSHLHR